MTKHHYWTITATTKITRMTTMTMMKKKTKAKALKGGIEEH